MNPKKMEGMMKKMGISQTPLHVNRVVFEMDGSNLVIENPQVIKVMMQGQETYQINGEAKKEGEEPAFTDDDVTMVASQTGKSESEARKALEARNGDLAEAIIYLKG